MLLFSLVPSGGSLVTRRDAPAPYLPVQPDGQDVAGVAVAADLRALLEVVDVHLTRLRVAHHHHQAAGEEALHDADVGDVICGQGVGRRPRALRRQPAGLLGVLPPLPPACRDSPPPPSTVNFYPFPKFPSPFHDGQSGRPRRSSRAFQSIP